ncbi:MAG: RHS repeat-associated core domain-containing protein [Deltaproteobacteria bacterium]|nr:RHS repeat-associated core domain-containing protein [Deltaproteobacteria bacterium]
MNSEGRRLSRFVDGAFQTGYMHDTSGRLVAEVEPSGHLRSHFVYATESHSPDYMIKGGVRYYFAKDQLGSIRAVINTDTGTISQSLHYDEFGRVLADSNPGFQPFGFAGGHYDYETGLVRFGARDYDSEVGRWLSKDPILFAGGDTNLYGYVGNEPINSIDPRELRLTTSGSMRQNEILWRAIGKLRESKRGNQLYEALNNSDRSFNVRFRRAGDRKKPGSYAKCGEVVIDPTDIGDFYETTEGFAQYSLERILAHELGHLAGTRDSGPRRMDNINNWENPVMTPIDGNVRDAY